MHISLTGRARLTICAVLLSLPLSMTAAAATTTHHQAVASRSAAVNGRIAFATEGGHSQIYTVNPDGTDETRITHVPAGVGVDMPDWSPDGSRIAYVSNASGNFAVMVMNADGTDQHVVLQRDGTDFFQPKWSPDGTRFAVINCRTYYGYDTGCNLDLVNVDGSGLHVLVGGHNHQADPSWSPDGSQIAFTSDRGGLISAVWKVSLAGGLTRLTAPNREGFFPSWSPDGTQIMFAERYDGHEVHTFVMNTDGTDVTKISRVAPNQGAGFASYSPDGTQAVLLSNILPGPRSDIFVMNADGSDLHPIVTDHPSAFFTDWGPADSTAAATR